MKKASFPKGKKRTPIPAFIPRNCLTRTNWIIQSIDAEQRNRYTLDKTNRTAVAVVCIYCLSKRKMPFKVAHKTKSKSWVLRINTSKFATIQVAWLSNSRTERDCISGEKKVNKIKWQNKCNKKLLEI